MANEHKSQTDSYRMSHSEMAFHSSISELFDIAQEIDDQGVPLYRGIAGQLTTLLEEIKIALEDGDTEKLKKIANA